MKPCNRVPRVVRRIDYDTLQARVFGQFLFAWTPSPGTAFYAGYDYNLNPMRVIALADRRENNDLVWKKIR